MSRPLRSKFGTYTPAALALSSLALACMASSANAVIVPYCTSGEAAQAGNDTPHCNLPTGMASQDAGSSRTIYNAIRMFTGRLSTGICSSNVPVVCVKRVVTTATQSGFPGCTNVGSDLTIICNSPDPDNRTYRARCESVSVTHPWANCWKSRQ